MSTYTVKKINFKDENGNYVTYDILPGGKFECSSITADEYYTYNLSTERWERNYMIKPYMHNVTLQITGKTNAYVTIPIPLFRSTKYSSNDSGLGQFLRDLFNRYGDMHNLPCVGSIYIDSSYGWSPIDYAYIYEDYYEYDDYEEYYIQLDIYYHAGLTDRSTVYVRLIEDGGSVYGATIVSDTVMSPGDTPS